jgi:TRAP-type uncharacterized transport system fused permease subunit
MDKSRVIGGIICLVIAAFLGVLYFALPRDELMFMVGESDIFLPPIILGVVGIMLLLTARKRET